MQAALVIVYFLFNAYSAWGQECYNKSLGKQKKVFSKTLHYPSYKGGDRELASFLMKNINIYKAFESLPSELPILDSAVVRLVISRKARMSDIMVTSSNSSLSFELRKAFIKSSCNWIAGGTERLLDVWYSALIIVRQEKTDNSSRFTVLIEPKMPLN